MRPSSLPPLPSSLPASILRVSLLLLVLLPAVLSSPPFPSIPWLAPPLPIDPPRVNDPNNSCLSPTSPSYDLAPNPRLLLSLVYSSAGSDFYFWPCGSVTASDCTARLGYSSQLCEVRTKAPAGVFNLIPSDPRHPSYNASTFSFTALQQGALDLHTQSGDWCATRSTERYNVSLHFRCAAQALNPTLTGLFHDPLDFCRVEGTVLSRAYCEPVVTPWESSDVCHYGPYDLTPFARAGDLSVSDGSSTYYYHPCGFVQNDLCRAAYPSAVFCSITWHRDGSHTVTNVSLWDGRYAWQRLHYWDGAISPTDAVLDLTTPAPCSPFTRGSRSLALSVVWQCDDAAVVPVLELQPPQDIAWQVQLPRSCRRHVRVRSSLLCGQPGASTAAPAIGSSSTSTGGHSLSSSGPSVSSPSHLLSSSSSGSSLPAALSSSTGASALAAVPQMWSSEYLIIAVLGVTAAVCLFYCAVPLLTRYIHRTEPPPALPMAPDGTPYRAFGGGGATGTMGGMRGEGVTKSFLDLEQYGADGRWFTAPPRQ